MSQVQTRTTTKSGTLKTALSEEIAENKAVDTSTGITRDEHNAFLAQIADCQYTPGKPQPEIEVPRRMIEHLTRGKMEDFDRTHYLVWHNVRVYEEGKRDVSKRAENMSLEDKVFGGFRK